MQLVSSAVSVTPVRSDLSGRCPEGRTDRLKVINEREGLFECRGAAAVDCPHAVYFEGHFYCSALVRPEAA